MDAQPDPVEHAVASLPPFMQRRMAKLALAGARFILEAQGISAWKVEINGYTYGRFTHLTAAIHNTWREWLRGKPARDTNTEIALERLLIDMPRATHGPATND